MADVASTAADHPRDKLPSGYDYTGKTVYDQLWDRLDTNIVSAFRPFVWPRVGIDVARSG